jgi:hypothetical protein
VFLHKLERLVLGADEVGLVQQVEQLAAAEGLVDLRLEAGEVELDAVVAEGLDDIAQRSSPVTSMSLMPLPSPARRGRAGSARASSSRSSKREALTKFSEPSKRTTLKLLPSGSMSFMLMPASGPPDRGRGYPCAAHGAQQEQHDGEPGAEQDAVGELRRHGQGRGEGDDPDDGLLALDLPGADQARTLMSPNTAIITITASTACGR